MILIRKKIYFSVLAAIFVMALTVCVLQFSASAATTVMPYYTMEEIDAYLKEHGEEPEPAEIEGLPEKIADLEMEIAQIAASEPYTYKTLLEDPEAIEKKRSELEAEKEEYQAYKKELQAHLESLLTA